MDDEGDLHQYLKEKGSLSPLTVTWCRELMDEEAEHFLCHYFIDPNPERPWLAQKMALKIPLFTKMKVRDAH
ncbi:Pectinesterase 31 [Acorus calamus]|uniref:Pectinesterase 31 n=1 Tax=Acorus calamus TaxID=4465 RepID=A0AAV9F7K1_ACOCL|nr:Pectinesterase 31 [Acorus calamus]